VRENVWNVDLSTTLPYTSLLIIDLSIELWTLCVVRSRRRKRTLCEVNNAWA